MALDRLAPCADKPPMVMKHTQSQPNAAQVRQTRVLKAALRPQYDTGPGCVLRD
jgi:hypothetical protein